MLDRLRCLFGAHDWPAWSPWARRRDGVFVSTRKCRRCPRVAVLKDGVFDLEDADA
jgi:hypothetical protein